MDLKILYNYMYNLNHTHTHTTKMSSGLVKRWLAKIDLPVKCGSSEFRSQIYIPRERTMIDLGRMKNCLNCSYFALMLNTVKQCSRGKLLTTNEGEIPHARLQFPHL